MEDDETPSPLTRWPSVAHSRHATPAPDFTLLPPHFMPATGFPPFTAHIGGNNDDDRPAPSDRTPTAEPDPNMAAAHLINNRVREEIDWRLNPITRQLNTLTELMQRLSDKVFAPPPAVTQAAPSKATPAHAHSHTQNEKPSYPPGPQTVPSPQAPAVTVGRP
jgi:hypothetical protein